MPATTPPETAASVMIATRVRYKVLLLTFLTSFIMYMDRVCMGTATPTIMQEFGLDKITMGWSTSAFNWAYALFQVPGGWMADRYGARIVLALAMSWWSAFTAATGLAFNAISLAVARLFFGMGEAAAFPASSRALVRWLPAGQRAFGQGFQHAGSRFGAAVTPPIVGALIVWRSWHWVFYIFGIVGVVWAVIWYIYYRNFPQDHSAVNEAELKILAGSGYTGKPKEKLVVPWNRILRSRNVWFLSSMYFCYGWMLWMYLQWFPTYLMEARHLSLRGMALAASSPLLTATLTNMLGGWVSDKLAHKLGDLRRGRVLVSVAGFLIAASAVVAGVFADNLAMAIFCLSLAMGGLELTVAVSWAMALDIGGEYSGSVSAVMNTFGNVGGALAAVAIGYLATNQGWNTALLVASPMCFIAAILATRVDPRRSAVEG